jgi:predicted O-methyltransferase YrrM
MGVDRLRTGLTWIAGASAVQLADVGALTQMLNGIGLAYDREGAEVYGSDVTYMQEDGGLRQTPAQLAAFLVDVRDKGIRRYLDIGTFNGWTVTVIVCYLKRFGLEVAHTYDNEWLCGDEVQQMWVDYGLPIEYFVGQLYEARPYFLRFYDMVWIDGLRTYRHAIADYYNLREKTRIMVVHDIVDRVNYDIPTLWREIKQIVSNNATVREFVSHPSGLRTMGIGYFEWKL